MKANSIDIVTMKALFLIIALLAPVAAQAEIVTCPINGRPYDTSHGYYVDVQGTDYYVEPEDR